nr:hypothetical protein Iba_chr06cCG13810 [Ipomoea batatas]
MVCRRRGRELPPITAAASPRTRVDAVDWEEEDRCRRPAPSLLLTERNGILRLCRPPLRPARSERGRERHDHRAARRQEEARSPQDHGFAAIASPSPPRSCLRRPSPVIVSPEAEGSNRNAASSERRGWKPLEEVAARRVTAPPLVALSDGQRCSSEMGGEKPLLCPVKLAAEKKRVRNGSSIVDHHPCRYCPNAEASLSGGDICLRLREAPTSWEDEGGAGVVGGRGRKRRGRMREVNDRGEGDSGGCEVEICEVCEWRFG